MRMPKNSGNWPNLIFRLGLFVIIPALPLPSSPSTEGMTGTAVAAISTSTQGGRLLRPKFVPEVWTGHLGTFRLPFTKGDVPLWDAGIGPKNKNPKDRYIFTAVNDKPGAGAEMKRKVLFTEANSGTKDANNDTLSNL